MGSAVPRVCASGTADRNRLPTFNAAAMEGGDGVGVRSHLINNLPRMDSTMTN
jgi:hypothetical protein